MRSCNRRDAGNSFFAGLNVTQADAVQFEDRAKENTDEEESDEDLG